MNEMIQIMDVIENALALAGYDIMDVKGSTMLVRSAEQDRTFSVTKRDLPQAHEFIRGLGKFDRENERAPFCQIGIANSYVIIYNIHIKEYRRTNTTVSMINYHLIFCPRYRRKIFLIDGVEARFKELVNQICEQNKFKIIAMECDKDHCHLFVNVPPTVSPHIVMKMVKGATSKILRSEFPQLSKMPSLWMRSYFVSTAGEVSSAIIEQYIRNQKTR